MYAESNDPKFRDDLEFSISPSCHRTKIFIFLREILPEFAQRFIDTPISDLPENIDYEDYISGEIVNYSNDKLRESGGFLFQLHERNGPDISIFISPYQLHAPVILVIEAKRLRAASRRDYVSSGIQRFKDESHGKGEGVAAMLGYVQENDFDHWYAKVNSWIGDRVSKGETNWESSDRLDEVGVKGMGEYKSEHSRINDDSITLYHFWIDLTGNKQK